MNNVKNTDGPSSLKNKFRILQVDDNILNNTWMELLLKRWGHKAVTVQNGQEAVDMIRKQKFDLVFMDLNMPVMNGCEALYVIREEYGLRKEELPILIITSDTDQDRQKQCIKNGANAILEKPLNMNAFKKVLRSYFAEPEKLVSI